LTTLATWNVEGTKPRSAARLAVVREALAALHHDVLVLTESYVDIPALSGLRLSATSSEAPDREREGRWVCIWTSTAISAESLAVREEAERSAAVLLSMPSGRQVIVFGTVLPWRTDSRRAGLRGGAAFEHSLNLQARDITRLRAQFPGARFWMLGDFNQEIDASRPAGTAVGRAALKRFLAEQNLLALTGGATDPLRRERWRDSIDHICVDAKSAASASPARIWPNQFPLPGRPWPDHHGVEVSLEEE